MAKATLPKPAIVIDVLLFPAPPFVYLHMTLLNPTLVASFPHDFGLAKYLAKEKTPW